MCLDKVSEKGLKTTLELKEISKGDDIGKAAKLDTQTKEVGEQQYLLFGLTTQFEVFASLDWQLFLGLTHSALHTKHNLLGGLGLLLEDGLGLTTEALLLAIVTATTL